MRAIQASFCCMSLACFEPYLTMIKTHTILFILLAFGLSACEQSDPPKKEFSLVWSDEFDGTELDEDKWEYQLGDGSTYGLWLWGNNEEQYYKEENVLVENGVLKIVAKQEQVGNFDYTSARIRSLNKADFKYGRIETSIRMANTAGLWHAFWMLPSDPSESWPVSGEIDIMEYVGNSPDQIYSTVHFADQQGNHNQLGQTTPIFQDNLFHTFVIEWDENRIVWYRDGIETYSLLRSNEQINSTWPFDAKFHLLLNTAVGGNLGGNIDANAMLTPRLMEVQYVRVYQEL